MLKKETLDALNDAKKNLANAITHHRTDIVISLLKEWFKKVEGSGNEELIERKYFFNEPYCENNTKTPLQIAFNLQNRDIVRALLTFGADPSVKDLQTNKTFYQLVKESNDSHMKQIFTDTLFQAIVQNDINQIILFINSGYDLNTKDNLIDANSLLHWAAIYSNEDVIKLLIDNGAHVNSLNKNGCTPLHELLQKRKDLRIIELFLKAKVDWNIKAIDGKFKDKSIIDICSNDPELCALMAEYSNESISEPQSPINSPQISRLDSNILKNEPINLSKWFENEVFNTNYETKIELIDLLWPKPQKITFDCHNKDVFVVPNADSPISVYIKPPNTYASTESFKNLARAYSFNQFEFLCKKKELTQILMSIDENFFHVESSYTINIKKTRIEIVGNSIVACQYAFSTLIQLFKIYSDSGIPLLKILDYPNVKYRGVLIDFSQGFYTNFDYLLSFIQMLAFYKFNQLHVYIRVSAIQHDKIQWFDCIENWYSLIKFSQEFHIDIIPSIDICNDVSELDEVMSLAKEYLDLFQSSKFINIGPRLSSMLICMENKNPFDLKSSQYLMLCSYLLHNSDNSIQDELDRFDNLILMEYGIKVGHKFDEKCNKLVHLGKPFYLCVGSSNWNSLFGCHEACIRNIFDAVTNFSKCQPLGLLLCNFTGALQKTSHPLNLISTLMFSGPSWNTDIGLNEFMDKFPHILRTHGILSENDGSLALITLELGYLETYLTRKANNRMDLEGFPLDSGSLFSHLMINPDDIELDNIDLTLLKKSLFSMKKIQSKFCLSLLQDNSDIFKEIKVFLELSILLLKFLISLYMYGMKKQANTIGFNVINVGVSNLPETIKTDVANKMISIVEELENLWPELYYKQSLVNQSANFHKYIQKLLNHPRLSISNQDYKIPNSNHNFSQSIYFREDD